MKLYHLQMTILLVALPLSFSAQAGLPTTADSAFKSIAKYGFFNSFKGISFITSADSPEMAAAVLDDDLNVHYVMCDDSENEHKSSAQKTDWEAVRLREVKSPQTVNVALFGPSDEVPFREFLLGLKQGKLELARLTDNNTLIECRALDTFTQQELLSVGEEFNRQAWTASTIAKKVVSGLTYKILLSHYGWAKCVDDPFSAYYRIQEDVKIRTDSVDQCKNQQQLTGLRTQEYLYAQSMNGLQGDIFEVRQILNKIQGKPVLPYSYENVFGQN
jgi:hypothetical protein